MIITDILVVSRGGVIFVNSTDEDLSKVHVGTKLTQGENTWEVVGVEASRPSTQELVSILLKPARPAPERGEIAIG